MLINDIIDYSSKPISKLSISSSSLYPNVGVGDWCNGAVSWDPHNQQTCAVVSGADLRIVDTRTMEVASMVAEAHRGGARYDILFSSN